MTKPILYDYWRSSAGYRVRIALNLKGLPFDSVPIDLLAGAQRSPEHLERNPQGLVPAIDLDGETLTQSLAIIEYLDETTPAPRLIPDQATARARVRSLSHAIAMDIHPVCNLKVVRHVCDLTGGGDETKAAWMRAFIRPGIEAIETLLDHPSTGAFCHGDAPTMADCCLIPQLYNAERWSIDHSDLTRTSRVAASCNALDAFQAAHPDRFAPT